jgi:hypothetical protein
MGQPQGEHSTIWPPLITISAPASLSGVRLRIRKWLISAAEFADPETGDLLLEIHVADGRITRIYAVWNPHKLARLDTEAALTR